MFILLSRLGGETVHDDEEFKTKHFINDQTQDT